MIVLVSAAIAIILACVVLLIGEVRRYLATARNKQPGSARAYTFKSPKVSWPSITWIISLTLLCAGIIASGYLYPRTVFLPIAPEPASSSPGYLQGYNLGFGLLIWLIFAYTIGRQQGRVEAAISFLAISGSVFVTVRIADRQSSIAMSEIQRQVSSLAGSAPGTQALPQRSEAHSASPRARGEFGEIERFVKTWLNQMASLQEDYAGELAEIGWETILDPERLARDSTLIMSKLIVQKAKDIVAKYRTWTYVFYENTRQAIPNLSVSERVRQEMANGFDYLKVTAHARHDALWEYESRIIATVEQIFVLLSSRRGAWVVEDGRIVFANQSDLTLFNSYMTTIEKLTSEQEAFEKQNIEKITQELDGLY